MFIQTINVPVDFNITLEDGQRLLGNSTTWFGLAVALSSGAIIESFITSPYIGLFKGLLMFLGHALGSFLKRRMKRSDGQFLPIIDHGDSIIVTGLGFGLLHLATWPIVIEAIIVTLAFQPLLTYLAYSIGLRKYPL